MSLQVVNPITKAILMVVKEYSWKNRLIGLSGHAGVGKDTAAQILVEHDFEPIALADPVRRALYILNPIVATDSHGRPFCLQEIVDDMGWDEAKVYHAEIRRLMQVFGTDIGRKMFGLNVWVDMARKKIEPNGKYVITDVRFQNEADAVLTLGGTLIKITRPGVGPVNGHSSDAGLGDGIFDFIVHNDGKLSDLRRDVLYAAGLTTP